MKIKYDLEISSDTVKNNMTKLINQTYKLLPEREEGGDWSRPLSTIIEELCGMGAVVEKEEDFFPLLCKLEGLYSLDDEEDFFIYRRTILECLRIQNQLVKELCQD